MLPVLSLSSSPSTGTIKSEGVRGFMFAVWGLLGPAMLASGALFVHRRKLQPIKGRGPYLVLCGLAVCLSYLCFICAQWAFPPRGYSCPVVLTFGAIHNSALCVVYVWRCLRLWFKARLADEMAQEQSLKRHRRVQSPYAYHRRVASTATPNGRARPLETSNKGEEGVRSPSSPGERSVVDRDPKSVHSSMVQLQALSNVYDTVPAGHSEVDSDADQEEISRPQSNSVHFPVPAQLPPVPVDSISRGARSNSYNAAGRAASPPAQSPAAHPGPPPVRIFVDKSGPTSPGLRPSSPPRAPASRRVQSSGAPLTTAQRMAAELQLLSGGEPGMASGRSSARSSPHGSPRGSVTYQRRSVLFSVTANSFSKKSADGDGPSFWFVRHRFLDRNPAIFLELVAALGLFVVIPLVAIFSVYSLPTDEPVCTFVPVRYFSILTVLVAAAAFMTIGMQLRRVSESFFIKREMVVGGAGVLGAVILYAIALFGVNSFSHNSFPLHYLAALIAIVVLWSTSVLWPLARSFDCSRPSQPAPAEHQEPELECTLEQVLEDPVGIELFSEHLRSEFSLENLVFWESVEDFRALIEDPELEEEARRDLANQVYEACIEPGAYFEVNLPHAIRLPLLNRFRARGMRPSAKEKEKDKDGEARITFSAVTASQPSGLEIAPTPSLGSLQGSEGDLARTRGQSVSRRSLVEAAPPPPVKSDLFDAAQRSIFRLMESDSFVRFCSTPAYRKFVNDYYAPPAVSRKFQTSAGSGQLQYGNARDSSPSPSNDHVAPLPNDRFFEFGGSLRAAVTPVIPELPAVTISSLTSPSSSDNSFTVSPSPSSKPSNSSPSPHHVTGFALPMATVEDRSTSVSTSASVHGESVRLLPAALGPLPPAALPVSASTLNGPIPSGAVSPGGRVPSVRRNLSLLQKQGSFTSLSNSESFGSKTPRGADRDVLSGLAAARPQSSPYLDGLNS